MIRFERVSKRFADARQASVQDVDLQVDEGTTLVLIGPSGCGKTTTLRTVNRLVEPTSGRVLLGGRDVAAVDPVTLRRGIGYVIQGVGLFPHRTVAGNVATVPRLLGWDEGRVARRTDEMLALVGLDPASYRERRPASLSGGQRQRVGVARALAADPPVLLMDEPFGAVDPLERGRLQGEVAAILRALRKTVILVTHDIDEAIRMGDRVAVMRNGRVLQHDAPDRLLAAPADPFVADFVGPDRELKRLGLVPAASVASAGAPPPGAPLLADGATMRDALALLLGTGAVVAGVPGRGGEVRAVTLDAIRAHGRATPERAGARP